MGFGRRYLWALALGIGGQEEAVKMLDPTQSLITAFPPVITTPSPTEDPMLLKIYPHDSSRYMP